TKDFLYPREPGGPPPRGDAERRRNLAAAPRSGAGDGPARKGRPGSRGTARLAEDCPDRGGLPGSRGTARLARGVGAPGRLRGMPSVMRVLDANANRAREALRVME